MDDTKKISRRKKAAAVIFALLLLFTAVVSSGCGNSAADDDKFSVVTTIFPEYDWVKQIASGVESVEVTLLLDNGVDLHNYQPTADDIVRIAKADVFIYVGGESDAWVDDVLKSVGVENLTVINLLDALGDAAKEEETVEGMMTEEEEDDGEGPEYDEHVWLSLRNAATLCGVISDALCEADPDNAGIYKENAADYIAKLNALDREYAEVIEGSRAKTLVFGDRFPFRYLADDYGLSYYAAFAGCSAETEASFRTIVFLAGKIDEMELRAVMQIESSDGAIARTVRDNTKSNDVAVLVLDSLQSKTLTDANNGVTYLSVMESNLPVLKEALK